MRSRNRLAGRLSLVLGTCAVFATVGILGAENDRAADRSERVTVRAERFAPDQGSLTGVVGATTLPYSEPALPALSTAAEAISVAMSESARWFNGISGNEAAEVLTTTVGEVADEFPGWFADLWPSLPRDRLVYVVVLRGAPEQFVPARSRPLANGDVVKVGKGNSLVVFLDSAREFAVRRVGNDLSVTQGLRALGAVPSA